MAKQMELKTHRKMPLQWQREGKNPRYPAEENRVINPATKPLATHSQRSSDAPLHV